MAISPLAASMIGGSGMGNDSALMMAADPALLTAMPQLQLAQQMEQTGTSSAPAYPGQALARALQAGIGASLQKDALSGLAQAYAGVPDAAAEALNKGGQANNPAIAMLKSTNPMVRMMGLQMLQKTVPIQSEYQRSAPGQEITVGPNVVHANQQPRSPIGIAQSDAANLQAGGNPQGATAVERGVTKETSTPEGVQFPPTPVTPTPAQMQDARGRLADQMNAVNAAGITSPTATGVAGSGPPPAPASSSSPESMPQQIAAAKGTQEASEKLYGGAAGSLGKAIGDVIEEGGKPSRDKMNALNSIQDALTFGGKGITTGPWADTVLRAKQTLDGLGVDTGWIKTGLPEAEVVQKLNSQLASAAAKSLTGRPSQFEFATMMKNNPGLATSKEGTLALIDILRQGTQQDIDLGRLAQNKGNWEKWGDVTDQYYQAHPLVSPFTRQPMSSAAVNVNAAPGASVPVTAINRQTGQRVQLVNGKWQPLQ